MCKFQNWEKCKGCVKHKTKQSATTRGFIKFNVLRDEATLCGINKRIRLPHAGAEMHHLEFCKRTFCNCENGGLRVWCDCLPRNRHIASRTCSGAEWKISPKKQWRFELHLNNSTNTRHSLIWTIAPATNVSTGVTHHDFSMQKAGRPAGVDFRSS